MLTDSTEVDEQYSQKLKKKKVLSEEKRKLDGPAATEEKEEVKRKVKRDLNDINTGRDEKEEKIMQIKRERF